VDAGRVFGVLGLAGGGRFLDLACGRGDYSIAAAEIVGPTGVVHAVDLWEEGIALLKEAASRRGLANIRAVVGDVAGPLPLDSGAVEVCLMSTVLHDLVLTGDARRALDEAFRVLVSGGVLGVLEFKLIEGPPGPPLHIRLGPEAVTEIAAGCGFKAAAAVDVGDYNYLIIFHATGVQMGTLPEIPG